MGFDTYQINEFLKVKMPRVTGPGLALEAHGSLGKIITYQKRPSGTACIKYSKPGSVKKFDPSADQRNQRTLIALFVAHWQCMTAGEKLTWETAAKAAKHKGSGYSYFIKKVNENPYLYHGLCGYWPMNEETGAQVADLSGNENHGMLMPTYPSNCPTRVDSINKKFRKALNFDGTNDYVYCGTKTSLRPDIFTALAWVKVLDQNENPVFAFSSSVPILEVHKPSELNKSIIYMGYQNFRYFNQVINVDDGKWHFVAFVVTGNGKNDILNSKMYTDGQLQTTYFSNNTLSPLPKDKLWIGRQSNIYYKGIIEDARLYNRILSPAEIIKQYNINKK